MGAYALDVRRRRANLPAFPEATKLAAKKNTAEGYAFLVGELKKNKNAAYADLKARADRKGLAVYPIMFGRAQAALGLVSSRKAGGRKAASAAPRRGPGRPRKAGRGSSGRVGSGLDGVLSVLQEADRNQAQLRETLLRIRELIDQVV
jgi:hypothetical protein